MIIAEVGCNHRGEMATAQDMVKVAAQFCQVDYVKFQKRNPRESLSRIQYSQPHPNPSHAYGATYGEHREKLELSIEQHRVLKELCEEHGVRYACSVWDITSAREVMALQPEFIKIPSATNQHYELLDLLCGDYSGQIHVSLGMTTRREEAELVDFVSGRGRAQDLVLYSCTSGYPVPAEDVCLLELRRLNDAYGERVHSIGFSGHHLGIAIDGAAQTLGAQWIERHFTLDRTWKGTDHAASLEPDGMRRLARDARAIHSALRYKPSEVLEIEQPQREKLKWMPSGARKAAGEA